MAGGECDGYDFLKETVRCLISNPDLAAGFRWLAGNPAGPLTPDRKPQIRCENSNRETSLHLPPGWTIRRFPTTESGRGAMRSWSGSALVIIKTWDQIATPSTVRSRRNTYWRAVSMAGRPGWRRIIWRSPRSRISCLASTGLNRRLLGGASSESR